jgi:hypothetical protein
MMLATRGFDLFNLVAEDFLDCVRKRAQNDVLFSSEAEDSDLLEKNLFSLTCRWDHFRRVRIFLWVFSHVPELSALAKAEAFNFQKQVF